MRSESELYGGLAPCQCHHWEKDAPYCSCGQDTVTCQGCGKLVCGNVALRVSDPSDSRMSRNVGPCCFAKFGLGHQGTSYERDPHRRYAINMSTPTSTLRERQ
jgi:hypothetical protein